MRRQTEVADALGRPRLPDLPAGHSDELRTAVADGRVGVAAAAAAEAVRRGASDAWLAAVIADRLGPVLANAGAPAPALWAVCDLAALAASAEPDQRGPAWAAALATAAELPMATAWPAPAGRPGDLASALGAGDGDGAAAMTVHALEASGATAATQEILQWACWHAGDLGVGLVTAHKVGELSRLAGPSELLPALARWLADRRDASAATAAHVDRQSGWRAQLTAIAAQGDAAKARAFVEPKFRAHVTDGGVAGALRAMRRGAEAGVPQELLCQSLVLAAAERLWRCDDARLRQTDADERRGDLEAVFALCASVRQLHGRVDGAAWVDALFYATALVAGHAALDLAPEDRPALPEPAALHQTWDHGPEIAKVIGQLQARRAAGAIAVLRAYLLLGLPEQPLVALLRDAVADDWRGDLAGQGLAVATLRAGVDEFCALHGHPQREWVLVAAMASVCAPAPAASTVHVARRAWQVRHLGIAAPALVAWQ
ncbi:MAG: hypothetical protein FJ100_06325 [Deltaproteobacteria bacterium]|nr:hypothetical protein [Deltaproteobacteria bacterium]